ncbi:cyclophilin-like fold protein [Agromyces mangrovi Wang et al. 2018]|uniref:cyclophilin-like fold protein n=1 Tax=Agromyces mangrovi TaxID=1858653 RepID=UPI0025723C25|nr:hypothetical protein [Agromyces mangrovi]
MDQRHSGIATATRPAADVARTESARPAVVGRVLSLVAASLLAAVGLLALAAGNPATPAQPTVVQVEWHETTAARHVSAGALDAVEFRPRFGQAVVARLPQPLAVASAAPIDEYRAGDVAYRVHDQSLYVFSADGTNVPDDGLVLVASVASGLDELAGCAPTCSIRLAPATG